MAVISKNVPFSFLSISGIVSVESAVKKTKAKTPFGICNHDQHQPTKLRQVVVCDSCPDTIPLSRAKAFPVEAGYAVLTPEDEKAVSVSVDEFKTMKISIYPAAEVELGSATGEKAYYLNPAAGATPSYAVLYSLIKAHPELAFVTRWASRTLPTAYRLVAQDGALLIQERIPAETEALKAPEVDLSVDPEMLELSEKLLGLAKVQTFSSSVFEDIREAALEAVAASKDPVAILGVKDTPEGQVQTESDLKAALMKELKRTAVAARRSAERKTQPRTKAKRPAKVAA